MEEFVSNSHKFKEQQKKQELAKTEKKVESVVTGEVKPKKKSELQKLASIFIAEDISNVKSYIVMDVIVPAIKDAIEDVVHMLLRGESGRSRKTTTASKVSYRSFYDRENDRSSRREPVGSSAFDYDEIVFKTRGDAEAVLDAMNEIISMYGSVSVGDLYDLANVQTSNYMVNKYGWTDIFGCKPCRVVDGYILKLPRPMPLNK